MPDLNQPTVLVLNKHWIPINTQSPVQAIGQLSTDASTALDIDGDSMIPIKWEDWIKLPIRPQDLSIHTVSLEIRIPTVIVLSSYAKIPRARRRFSTDGIWHRDGGVCQYTGRKLKPGEGNRDHIIPRSRGGATSWENCVLADKRINALKGDRLPEEAGLKLIRKPTAPPELPVNLGIRNRFGIPDWEKFIGA